MKLHTSIIPLLFFVLFFTSAFSQPLRVSDNQRYLEKADGTPFFWLGDTAWELFHRLDREEALHYLQDRAEKGFTVIQAVVLAEFDGLHTPNAYGHTPLSEDDPARPDEAYFEHVDFIVDKAAAMGLYMGILPTWGDKFNKKWGVGPEIFTPENAYAYGEFLGRRYKDKPVIWILGGDRIPEEEEDFAIIRAMARGLEDGGENSHLMTYHPMGGRNSSEFFHHDAWLDFNMFQSGHGARDIPNYKMNFHNLALTPAKPTLDGEPCYEDHPVNWKPENGWFSDADVRQAAYWSVLSGACGHTYGNHNVWQMLEPGQEPVSSARTPWREAINQPGALQMGHLRRLMESRPFTTLLPDPAMVLDRSAGEAQVQVGRGDGFIMAYLPAGPGVELSMGSISGRRLNTWWFDPRTGDSVLIGQIRNKGSYTFRTPNAGKDWVLLLDDASRDFPPPGSEVLSSSQAMQ